MKTYSVAEKKMYTYTKTHSFSLLTVNAHKQVNISAQKKSYLSYASALNQ